MTDDTPDPVLEALSALRDAGIGVEPVGEEFERLYWINLPQGGNNAHR